MENSNNFNKNAYNKMAQAYETKRQSPKDSYWNKYIEEPAIQKFIIPILKSKNTKHIFKILDLGCGTGRLTHKLLHPNTEVFGMDISEEMIKIAREKYSNIEFHLGESSDIPFENENLDLIVSSLMFHYIKNLQPSFNEAARVLKPGAHLIFSMHHPVQETLTFENSTQPKMNPYFHNHSYSWKMCGEELISYHHTFENIAQALNSAGFVISNIKECVPEEKHINKFEMNKNRMLYPTFCVFDAVKYK